MNRRNDTRTLIGALLFVFWIALVIALYFVIHKPWWGELNLKPFTALLDIVLAVILVSLAGGVGHQVLPGLEDVNPLERIALECAVGLGILSLVVLVIGLLGWFSSWVAWLGIVVGLVGFRKGVQGWIDTWRILIPKAVEVGSLSKIALMFVVFLCILNLFWALAPPLKWDSLVYHLQVPLQYVNAGGIFFYPENLYAGFPQLAGMLYTWAIALGSVTTAAVLGWAVSVILFIGIDGFARRIIGQRAAWLAPAVLLTGFSVSQAMHWAYVDLWIMLFGLLMLVCLDHYLQTNSRLWLLLAGSMIGFAFGTKYTAGMLLLIGALVLLPVWDKLAGRTEIKPETTWQLKVKSLLVDWITLAAVVVLVTLPWLIKNLLLSGNPFYPLLFNPVELDPWRQTFQSGPKSARSLINDLLLPIELTFYGIEGAVVEGKLEYGASIGPLMLALIPGLLLGWKRFQVSQRRSLFRLLVAAFSTWLIWNLGAHIADELMRPRHYYGTFPAFAILAVGGFEAASSIQLDQIRIRRVLAALLVLTFSLSAYAEWVFFVEADPIPVVMGSQSREDYLSEQLGGYGDALKEINTLPPGSRVYFLWEPRTLYCQQVTCYLDGTLDNWWYLRNATEDVAQIQPMLCQKGITHVLVNDLGLEVVRQLPSNLEAADWSAFETFKRDALDEIINFGESYSLYQLICSE